VSEPDTPGKDERFLARRWPDQAGVVRKVAEVRLVHATQSDATLNVVYIFSNESGECIDGLKKMLQKEGWTKGIPLKRFLKSTGTVVYYLVFDAN
jgi:hypothetical protein